MKRVILWKTKMNQEEDSISIGEPFSEHAWKARDITSAKTFCDVSNKLLMTYCWTVDQAAEFDELIAMKKDSALGPDGIPCGAYRCAESLGSKFLFNAYRAFLEGGAVRDCFAESRIVFIPKTSDIDDNGRILRSPDAIRPLTECTCDCKLLTSAICRGLHWYSAFIPHRDASPQGK